mmetsp:Transcript_25722/g.69803  ORF Transcript_25722/g.69803 Transcript_25722/m.69803 type:complete len:247 (+) Transcript_25722:310-1050(+)
MHFTGSMPCNCSPPPSDSSVRHVVIITQCRTIRKPRYLFTSFSLPCAPSLYALVSCACAFPGWPPLLHACEPSVPPCPWALQKTPRRRLHRCPHFHPHPTQSHCRWPPPLPAHQLYSTHLLSSPHVYFGSSLVRLCPHLAHHSLDCLSIQLCLAALPYPDIQQHQYPGPHHLRCCSLAQCASGHCPVHGLLRIPRAPAALPLPPPLPPPSQPLPSGPPACWHCARQSMRPGCVLLLSPQQGHYCLE